MTDRAIVDLMELPGGAHVSRHRVLFCFILMTTSCALASLVFTCATPFVALAVFAAATLQPAPALATVLGTWLLDQAIGYGLLGYPISPESFVWGAALGASAVVATIAAASALNRFGFKASLLRYAFAFVAAFAAYELCLIIAGGLLGSLEAFALAIVARIAVLNVVWFLALAAIWRLVAGLLASVRVSERWTTA
jgi:hypothetical protein